jgi:hypothetical protein
MIPEQTKNIYPTNQENIRAILNFYFQIPDGEIEFLFEQKKFTTNQIEFIAHQVSNNLDFIKNSVGSSGLTIENAMKYGIDAMTELESNWKGSQPRKRITKELKELIVKSRSQNL